SGRHWPSVRQAFTPAGLQRGAADDAPPELPRAAAAAPVVSVGRAVTAGGSSLPAVQRLLAVLAVGRRCAETGTAFGEGAAAIASTAASLVTVERDEGRAAGPSFAARLRRDPHDAADGGDSRREARTHAARIGVAPAAQRPS